MVRDSVCGTLVPSKIISGFVDVPQSDLQAFEDALPKHSELTNAESGCQYFRVTPHPSISGRFIVEETFDDEAAYQTHMDRTRQTEWFHITRNITRSY